MGGKTRSHGKAAASAMRAPEQERRGEPKSAAFAGLRQQLKLAREDARAPAKADPPRRSGSSSAGGRTDDDASLFRKATAGTFPLRTRNQAVIERPRPAPVPRAREPELQEPPAQGTLQADPLLDAYAGVTPLRPSNRVEMTMRPARELRQPATIHAAFPGLAAALASDDEADPACLFRHAVGATLPISGQNRVELSRPLPQPLPLQREQDERAALDESMLAPMSLEDRLDGSEEPAFLRPGLPRRVLSDLRRGRWVVQGELDLHGLVRDEARSALGRFLHDSLQQGRRCVRIIHGKGHGSPGKVSILKQLSRGWLAQRDEILAFCQASRFDGGSGALYVLLRAQDSRRPQPR